MKVPKVFICNFLIIAMTKICITFYQVTLVITSDHALPLFITPYHTISPRLETKPFSFGNFKTSSRVPNFLSQLTTPCHSLSHLITPYPLGWKQNHFHFTFGNFKFSSQSPNFLSQLITPCHCLSHFIAPYPQGWKQSQFHLVTLKLVPSPLISYHILSFLVTTYHILSHLIP